MFTSLLARNSVSREGGALTSEFNTFAGCQVSTFAPPLMMVHQRGGGGGRGRGGRLPDLGDAGRRASDAFKNEKSKKNKNTQNN